jgi:hypothetical protein
MLAIEGHRKGQRGDKGRNRMGMTPKRRGARAKFWFSTKTSKTCLGRPLPSRLVVSRFTNVPQLKRRCAVSKERYLASLWWIKAPPLSRDFGNKTSRSLQLTYAFRRGGARQGYVVLSAGSHSRSDRLFGKTRSQRGDELDYQ